MDRYIIDAGPLIHLDQINHLKILHKLNSIIIPSSVIDEIQHDIAGNVMIINIQPMNNLRQFLGLAEPVKSS